MREHPLLTAAAPAGLAALAVVVLMVVGQADLGLDSILFMAGLAGLAVFVVALAVLWLVEAYSRPRD